MTPKSLHQTLLARLDIAKRFTKEYQESLKEWITDYDAQTPKVKSLEELIERDQRYMYTAKVVQDNVEKYRSATFEKPPEVMYTKKGKNDEEKAKKVEAAWDYLKDKVNFKQFMDDTYTYFALGGFTTGHVGYKKEPEMAIGEDGQEYTRFKYDDPILEAYDHENEWFMPDSEFSPDAKNVSYFRKKKLTPSAVKEMFDVDVEADEAILSDDVSEEKEAVKSELMRVGVFYYMGTVPKSSLFQFMIEKEGLSEEEVAEQLDEIDTTDTSETRDMYYVVFTKEKVLYADVSPIGEPTCALGRWYALPQKFFGYGLGKLLQEQQRQESIRIGQLVRYADLYAFPKLGIEYSEQLDPKQVMQRNNPVIQFRKNKPEYLVPPGSNGAIQAMLNQNQSDTQMNSGLTDISRVSSSTTLQTATGQTQVADSNEKRVKIARDKYFEFLKQVIIKIFKYAQSQWDEEKVRYITDDDGNVEQLAITRDDLVDVDFDTDISIDFESVSVNKDVVRQQAIVLYDKVKDDPLVDRAKVFKKMLRDGFGEKNPDQFIKQSQITPGMTFTGDDGMTYVADESGTVVPQQDMNDTRATDGEMQPASDQMGVQTNPAMQVNNDMGL